MKRLLAAVKGAKNVEPKMLFGCEALFKDGQVFAMIWKDGRVGLRFEDEETHDAAMAVKGATPWAPNGKVMRKWVLLPDTESASKAKLGKWAMAAHSQAIPKKK